MKLFKVGGEESSRNIAKERLKLMLVQDRIEVSPGFMEELREALLASLGKFLEVDKEGTKLSLELGEKHRQLIATVPIKRVKRKLENG